MSLNRISRSLSEELSFICGVCKSNASARSALNACKNDINDAAAMLLSDNGENNTSSQELNTHEQDWKIPIIQPYYEIFCKICFDSIHPQDAIEMHDCGHCFCIECAKNWTLSFTTENFEGSVICPLNSACGKNFTQVELRYLIGDEALQKLDRRALEIAIASDPNMYMCPTPDCPNAVHWIRDDTDSMFYCDVCEKTSCLLCKSSPYHVGMTCDEANQPTTSKDSNDDSKTGEDTTKVYTHQEAEELTKQFIHQQTDIKPCKRCGTAIYKSDGCDKVKCRCGYRFCFQCLTENATCQCTPSFHGFWDNQINNAEFNRLTDKVSPS